MTIAIFFNINYITVGLPGRRQSKRGGKEREWERDIGREEMLDAASNANTVFVAGEENV